MKFFRCLCLLLFILSYCQAQKRDHNVVLVNIDTLGRREIAQVIDRINSCHPKVVAIDLQFSSFTDSLSDQMLCCSLQKTKCLVMASVIDDYDRNKLTYNRFTLGSLPEFLVHAKTGFANTLYDDRDTIPLLKQFSVVEKVNGKKEYHFAIRTAMAFDSLKAKRFIDRHKKVVDVDFVNHSFRKISSDDFLKGACKCTYINHKIVLVGFMGPGDADKFFTPVNQSRFERDMYGLEYLAHIIAQIL